MSCIGCDLAQEKINTYSVFENNFLNVILDLYPYSKGHLLILPKAHYENISDLPKDLLFEIMTCAQTMTKVLKKTFSVEDIILIQNNGSINSLKHFHLHVIPHDKHHNINNLFNIDVHEENDDQTMKKTQRKIINTLQQEIKKDNAH